MFLRGIAGYLVANNCIRASVINPSANSPEYRFRRSYFYIWRVLDQSIYYVFM